MQFMGGAFTNAEDAYAVVEERKRAGMLGNGDEAAKFATVATWFSLRRLEPSPMSSYSSSNSWRAGRLLYENWLLYGACCCLAAAAVRSIKLLQLSIANEVAFWLCCDMISDYYYCCCYLLDDALKWCYVY